MPEDRGQPPEHQEAPVTASDASVGDRPQRRVFASTTSTVVAYALVALLGALALHQLTRLHKSSVGEFLTVLNFIAIAMLLADLGVNTFTGREIARHPTDASSILGVNLGLRLVMSLVTIPVVVGVGLAIYSTSPANERLGIVLVALALPCEAIRAVALSYYVATIQTYKSALLGVLQQGVYFTGVLIALHLGFGLTGCFVAYLVALGCSALFAYVAVRRSVRFVPRFSWSAWRHILPRSLSIGSIQVVNVLYLRTNILLLSVMTNSHTVAQYGVAAAIVAFFVVVPNAYMTSVLPLMVTARLEDLAGHVNTALYYMAIVGVFAVAGTLAFGKAVIVLITSPSYASSAPVLSILSVSVLFTCFTAVFNYASFARDRHHRLLAVSIAGLVANVLLDVALIPTLHAAGAALSTVIVEAVLLVGTYLIFRDRVGTRLTGGARIARIFLAGGLALLVKVACFGTATTLGAAALVLQAGCFVVGFVVLVVLLRCLPPTVSARESWHKGGAALRGVVERRHGRSGRATR